MTTPLEFMKRELETIDSTVYSENVVGAALKIAEQFDKEGHSGFSIGFFYNAMRRYMRQAYKLRLTETLTWLEANLRLELVFGADELETTARKDHLIRVGIFDEMNIHDPKEVDQVFQLVKLYARMESIRPIDLKDDSLFESNSYSGNRHHRDDGSIFLNEEGELRCSDYVVFSPDGGHVWFTGRDSHVTLTRDHPTPVRRIYALRDGDEGPLTLLPLKRTCRPGSVVRNPHGEQFTIEGYYAHPDTTQPYFTLTKTNELNLCETEPLIVSNDTLISLEIEFPEAGLTLPAYAIWPIDVEKDDGK